MVSLAGKKLLSLMEFWLSIFYVAAYALEVIPKKIFTYTNVWSVACLFSFDSFIVLGLTLRSLVHSVLIFYMVRSRGEGIERGWVMVPKYSQVGGIRSNVLLQYRATMVYSNLLYISKWLEQFEEIVEVEMLIILLWSLHIVSISKLSYYTP
jgi:hypothetical protein